MGRVIINNAPYVITNYDRSRYIAPFTQTSGGTISNQLIVDGQGDFIDAGSYLKGDDWSDNGDGTWSTAENTFIADSARFPGWYRYGKEGDETLVVVKTLLENQGDFKWNLATSNITMMSSSNPFEQYGIIIVPGSYSGLINTQDYVTFRNFTIQNTYTFGARNEGTTGVIFDNVRCQWMGGGPGTALQARAGNGINFTNSNTDPVITNCDFFQIFDAGVAFEIVTAGSVHQMIDSICENSTFDRCGMGASLTCQTLGDPFPHTHTGGLINNNVFTNLGYGWSGYKANTCIDGNATHGKGVGFKDVSEGEPARATTSATVSNNTFDNIAWDYILNFEFDTFENVTDTNNTVTNETGAYQAWIDAGSVCDPWNNA